MPIYEFESPLTKETIEIIQGMHDEHKYIDENGLEWQRLFSSPEASVKGTLLDFRLKKDADKYRSVYKKRYDHNNKKK